MFDCMDHAAETHRDEVQRRGQVQQSPGVVFKDGLHVPGGEQRRPRELTADPQQAFPGQEVMKPEQAKIEWLRMEVAKLKIERNILK